MANIYSWKQYLYKKGLYTGSLDSVVNKEFILSISKLENHLASVAPVIKGMILKNNSINPNILIADIDNALRLIKKGQATLDALGDPNAEDARSGNPLNQMFITQEDSKLDEWDPKNHQNGGKIQNSIPKKTIKNKQTTSLVTNIDERMKKLTDLLEKSTII